MPLVDFRELTSDVITGESSAVIRERVADLAGKENIRPNDVLEAIQFRSLDRRLSE